MGDNLVHAVAGAGGGIVSMALTYPLITVSTRTQVDKSAQKASQVKTFQRILAEEGVTGFYSGIKSALFGIAVTQGVFYYFYEMAKAGFVDQIDRPLTVGQNMISGALAGTATAVMTNPIWVVNLRQTVRRQSMESGTLDPQALSTRATIELILKEDGVRGFWQGIVPALLLVVNPIIQFTIFERLKTAMEKRYKVLSGLQFFLLGAVSKLAATSITYPYIVIKSRSQLRKSKDASQRYNGVVDGLLKIIKHEGVLGLYKGIESKLVQSVLSSALTFAFKEELYLSAVWLMALLKIRAAQ
ncbi:hypothetical protein CXG81DRAFT_29504 [Caulochytrium protostelioides]|uniref:Mitochondrial carrier n=1 Tax=Caulochytrium protostelioides TaxID=1555241 RepID=A0A4V1IV18_9FUNG|nr:hypothetical protein CXG81DRAFT_29504 [Caulochytrium protostelioides]|eukprot:RKP02509.1 hypothetical protein CXG81DRAFT_29504 [Caulochytrium protostelioides]